ncbi:MAG: AAA family ATPase [Alphaproteobacteria bacterium]|nr:AAA family ATPase [Alphaproteobacteria bacterium]
MDSEEPPTNPDVVFDLGEVVTLPVRTAAHPARGQKIGCLLVLGVGDAQCSSPSRYLVKGLLYEDQLAVIFGEPSSGKSFLAAHIAYAVAQGRSVFGLKARPGPALYLSLEGGSGFEKRTKALANELGTTPDFHYVAHPVTFLSQDDAAASVIEAAKTFGVKLIVIDTLARALGAADENSSSDMGDLVRIMDEIRSATGACVIAIHHTPKASQDTPRGHSCLMGAADLLLRVAKSDTGAGTATVTKAKDVEGGKVLGFQLRQVEVGTDEDGDPLTTCIVDDADAPTKCPGPKLTDDERGAMKDIHDAFSNPSVGAMVRPRPDMPEVRAMSRDEVRDAFRKAGRFDTPTGKELSAADRQRFGRTLNKLKDKRRICMTDKHIWLPETA